MQTDATREFQRLMRHTMPRRLMMNAQMHIAAFWRRSDDAERDVPALPRCASATP